MIVTKRVLVVDDEPAIRELVVALLEDEGYEVAAAANGAEALDILAQRRPDLLLTDVMMPVMDGRELVERVKDRVHMNGLAVVMMSAAATRATSLDPHGTVAAFLPKPFDVDLLLNVVNHLLARREPRIGD